MEKEIQTISSTKLQVDETLRIKRCRYRPTQEDSKRLPRICIVSGIHGDELEGQYVCYELARRLMDAPDQLLGIVDLYPGANPLGIDAITRGVPGYDLDMNRIFPGRQGNTVIESVANDLLRSLKGADLVIDYHASNIFLNELPQARISEAYSESLVPLAERMNLDLIWVHEAATMLESTLSHSLNVIDTPCVVVEAGIGMRVTQAYGDQIVDGIMSVMVTLGIWQEDQLNRVINKPINTTGHEVAFINAEHTGIFISEVKHCEVVKRGDVIGKIVDALEGEILETIKASCDGTLFTLRSYPLVYTGSLIGRIINYLPKEMKGVKDA